MTKLQKMDLGLTALCAVLSALTWRLGWPVQAWTWGASAVFCAFSCAFSWADRLWVHLRPVFLRLALIRRLGGR